MPTRSHRKASAAEPDPDRRLTAAIERLEKLLHADEVRGEANCFPDVHDEWFAPYICAAKRLGWIAGYPDGTFQPSREVNRAEAIKIIAGSLGAADTAHSLPDDVAANDWFAPYVGKALSTGVLTNRNSFRPGDRLLRRDAAIWIYNGLGK